MRLGKNKQVLLPALTILLSITAFGQQEKRIRHQFTDETVFNNIVVSDHSLTINYGISELDIQEVNGENGSFYRITIPGHIPSTDPGKPELPVFSRLITVPNGADCVVRIRNVKVKRIRPARDKINGLLYPAQEGEIKELQQKKRQFRFDKALYATSNFIGSDTVSIEPAGILRGKKLANITISPVRYNPHSNIIEIITSMKIEIIFPREDFSSSKSIFPESPVFRETLDKGLLNYNPGDVINGYSDKPVRMIILTDTSFSKLLQPYITWKTQKGYKVDVLYKGDAFAGVTYTSLKESIANAYFSQSEGDTPPEYLLIVGDVNRIPYYGTGQVTDMYYGEFDGNGDYIPEMYIGRLPVADTNELKSVVKKLIQYEKFEFADTNKFYSGALMAPGYDAGYASYMNGQVKYAVSNYLTPENNIQESHFYYPQNLVVQKDSMIRLINKGISFINYTGHGDLSGWLHINVKTADIPSFTNMNKYPFIISNACQTSRFNAASFGNKMVMASDKGAIGFIGCSNDSYWDEDFYWAVGSGAPNGDPTYETTGLGALDRLFHTHGESPSDWYINMGQVNYAGNLSVSASNSSRKKYYWETYNLVGDPSIIPYIGTPGTFSTSLPDTLPDAITSYSFTGEPFSYIGVSHFDTLWDASYVSPSGSVTLELPGVSDDSCLFVITGQNRKPLIKKIYFSEVKGEFINLSGTSINDSEGNNNGVADFGETVSPSFTISNLGKKDAVGVYATISSTSEWVTINNDSVYIGTIAAGSASNLENDFSITLSEDIPDKGIITLDLKVKDSVSEKHYKVDIATHAPVLEIISYVLDDQITGNGNFIADPGETFRLVFKVLNEGTSSTSGQLIVSSPDADMSVLEPSKNSGTIQYGDVTEIPVLVKLSELVSQGTTISVLSQLDCAPHFVSKNITFRVGRIRESFEAASFKVFPWINLSPKPWTIESAGAYDGSLSAQSGAITHNQSSTLSIKVIYDQADSLKFWYKVSSETNYDFLIVKINEEEVLRKSGEIDWSKAAIPVKAGTNKIDWIYKKDQSVSQGTDRALIDLIDFAGPGSLRYINRDIATARIVSPVNKDNLRLEPVTVKLLNLGPDTINGFNMAYTVNGGMPVTQYFTNTILPFGDSVEVTFSTPADLSFFGNYDIETYSYANNDDYLPNDSLKVNIINDDIEGPLLVYPNPFKNIIHIIINSEYEGSAKISLFNMTGKKMLDIEKQIITGVNNIELTENNLAPAIYYLKIEFPGVSRSVPVLKVR
jgi:hypothetical protein